MSVAVQAKRKRVLRSPLGVILSSVMIAGAVVGFGPQVLKYIFQPDVARPLALWLHAGAMSLWLLLYLVQALLVRRNNVALHKRLGMAGAPLAIVIPFLMIAVSYSMDRFNHFTYGGNDASPLIVTQVNDILLFPALAWTGLHLRKRQEYHRRLMLMAAAVVTDAGWARVFEHTGLLDLTFSAIAGYLSVDTIIGVAIWFDRKRMRKLHRVWFYAVPPILIAQALSAWILIDTPQWWTPFWFRVLGLS
jgi:hypothetical protein